MVGLCVAAGRVRRRRVCRGRWRRAYLWALCADLGRDLVGGGDGAWPAGDRREDFSASFAFVIVFTRVAVREKHTRERAEELAAELVAANEQLRDAAVRTEELAMARERNRLAREIHDSLGHYLTTVAVQLEAARALHATEPARALSAVEKAHGLAREALVEVRRSVGALRAEGGTAAGGAAAGIRPAGEAGVAVNLRLVGSARRLGPERRAPGLFRVAQEGRADERAETCRGAFRDRDGGWRFPTRRPRGGGSGRRRARVRQQCSGRRLWTPRACGSAWPCSAAR